MAAAITPLSAQIPAFPGAEGYGAFATGGRGGDVYTVTNLNASGPGSFQEAISTVPSSGRTIVFAVSGYIRLPSGSGGTRMTASRVTIAGQTAPGDGIGFHNNNFRISGSDVVLRHLRFRRGKTDSSGDCLNLDSGSNRSMLDQLSIQFSTDENFSSFNSPPDNLTFQWSLNAWGLQNHSAGGLWDQRFATSHHNLWAHNHTRNPKARPSLLEWTNNVTFDWNIGFIMGDSQTPANWRANVIGNYFVCPPGNIRDNALRGARLDRHGNPNFSVYVANNLHDRDGDGILNGMDRGLAIVAGSPYNATTNPTGNYIALNTPVSGSAILNIDPPRLAYKKVVSNAGALRLDAAHGGPLRDEVDTRLFQNLVNQTRNIISRPSDLAGISNGGMGTLNTAPALIDSDGDGMPDLYETALGWNSSVQDHNTAVTGTTFFPPGTPSGYTRLEEYLHFKAVPHLMLQRNTASDAIDLTRYTSGFTNNPVFTLTNITGGTVAQSGPGGRFVTFTANNTAGRAGFNFTVTDAEGDSWTRQFAILKTVSAQSNTLRWRGTGSVWDTSSSNWLLDGNPDVFTNGDRAIFDDSGSAANNISVPNSVIASNIEFNSTADYTFTGNGGISASNQLVKQGTGTVTIGTIPTNSFSSIRLLDGTLRFNTSTAGGVSPIHFEGGSLSLAPGANTTVQSPLHFNVDAELTVLSQHNVSGLWQGTNRTVTVNSTSNHLWTITNHWNNFSGTLRVGTGNPRIRLNGTSNVNFGSANVAIDLGSGSAQFMNRNGGTTPYVIGSLASTGSSTVLGGTQTGTAETTWQVGALNTDTTFAGTITNGGGATNLTKTGNGTWTLSGTSTHTGNTTVASGALRVSGALGNSPVTVQSGALLGGGGSFGSTVTIQSGGLLSPGDSPTDAASLDVAGNLTLNTATLHFDLAGAPASLSDHIQVGGNLALNGTQTFVFNLLDGSLAPGTYDLIESANSSVSGVALNHNLPVGSRQSFAVSRSPAGSQPSKIWLTVTGNPATLTWTGATNSTWDTTTSGNWTGASPNTFFPYDAVVINDTAVATTITPAASVTPISTLVNNTTKAITLGGGLAAGTLTKSGTNTLTLTGANTYNGGTFLHAGILQLGNDTANNNGLGSGIVTFLGGSLRMHQNNSSYNGSTWHLHVPEGQSGTLWQDGRSTISGSLTGGGDFTLRTPWIRNDWFANCSAFTGTMTIITDNDGGDFRFGTNYAWSGLPNATLVLDDRVTAYYIGISADGAGTTIPIGELAGHAGSTLRGGTTGGRNFAYRIGNKTPAGQTVIFAGTIGERHPSVTTTIIKTGAGIWSLTGSGAWNGSTVVEEGSLHLAGPFACAGTTTVHAGAHLALESASLGTASFTIEDDATLTTTGHNTIESDARIDGTIIMPGATGGAPGQLDVTGTLTLPSGSMVHMRVGPVSDHIAAAADLAAFGTIHVNLAPETTSGRIRLISVSGEIDGLPDLTGIAPEITAHLSTTVPGGIDLVLNDPYEGGFPPPNAIEIVNPSFELPVLVNPTHGASVAGAAVPGWQAATNNMWVVGGFSFSDGGNPTTASNGNQFLTADRRAPDPDQDASSLVGGNAAVMTIFQDVDVTPHSLAIDDEARSLIVDFDYFDTDPYDLGSVSVQFLNHSSQNLGNSQTVQTLGNQTGWQTMNMTLHPPAGTSTIRITISATNQNDSGGISGVGSVRNIHFDNFRASLAYLDSDEDGLPDGWEMRHFGHLGYGPDDDPDGDGTSNLAEYRLGLNPADATSAFRASLNGTTLTWPSAEGIVFTVKRSLTLDGDWQTIATVTGQPGQATATFTDPEIHSRVFYQIIFIP